MRPHRLHDWVSWQADRAPAALAVACGDTRLTYAELDTLSTQLARLLVEGGCRRGDRVALLMPKSAMAIVGLLGIYKADAIYVPLDPSSPASRLEKILDSCENRWLLAAGPVSPLLEELCRNNESRRFLSIGWLDSSPPRDTRFRVRFTLDDVKRCPAVPLAARNGGAADPAHILFTSGSTGTPKGVVITHSNVIQVVKWAVKYFAMAPSDRLSGHFPLHFDLSFFDIFSAMAVGAELHLVPPDLVLPNKLAEFIRGSRLTQWFSVPSALGYMAKFNVAGFGDFPSLKRMLWCGEVLPTPVLIHWMQRLPHVTFTNLYGPTETTIVSSYYTVPACPDDAQAAIPIGVACDGEELLVLDESRHPVPAGETGDLYIGGVGLAHSYWRDPERTDLAFVPHPERPSERMYKTGDLARVGGDGLVYFLGRSDSQIKSRGYRIELGEIEAALNTIDGVQQSAVVALNSGGFEGALICCAFVPAGGSAATPSTLRRDLSTRVPAYMLPARWLAFEELPTNANGKVDRRRIKDLFAAELAEHAAQAAHLA